MTNIQDSSRILVLTFCVGEDYRRNLKECLTSKEDYCKRHGYTYILGGEEYWDRDRPASWSKVPFILKFMKESLQKNLYDYIWMSDADVLITNPDLRIEDHILPLFPKNKDLLMNIDACNSLNAGNIFFRPSEWAVDFLARAYQQTDVIYHRHWEQAGFHKLFEENEKDRQHLEITKKHYIMNAYLKGIPGERLWQHGDFLVHFAGVDDSVKMTELITDIKAGKTPRLDMWTNERLDV